MNFYADRFFINLIEFLSILLPCLLLTCLLIGEVGLVALGNWYAMLVGAQTWAAFLCDLSLGDLIFLLST